MPSELSQPPLPPKPAPPDNENPRGSWLAIALAGVFCLAIVVAISFLTLGTFAPVLAIGGGMLLIVGLHYCIWGWWLGKVIREAEEEEANEEN